MTNNFKRIDKRIENMTSEYSYFSIEKGKKDYNKFNNPLGNIWDLRIELIKYYGVKNIIK